MIASGERLRALHAGDVPSVFSARVADYRASRPDYPAALFDALLVAPAVVADVGAGTGLFTRGLLARGHEVHAVEPSAEMRAAAASEFAHEPRFHGVAGTAEATTLPAASVRLVTAAQAFHWFDVPLFRAECLRVLKRGGEVALVWNDRALEDPEHVALDEVFAEFGGEKRQALLAHEARRSDAAVFFNGAALRRLAFEHRQRLDAAGLQALVCSRSYMPARSSPAGAEVAARVQQVFDAHADGASGITLRYHTRALLGRPRA